MSLFSLHGSPMPTTRAWLTLSLILPIFAGCTTRSTFEDAASPARAPAASAALHTTAPDPGTLRSDLEAVVTALSGNSEGTVYSGAVDGTDPDHLAIAVALIDGETVSVGDTDVPFPLMSVSKPFTYALALEHRGADFMLETIGVSATGLPYNSVTAGAVRKTTEQNPMVNAGAIATHSYLLGQDSAAKRQAIVDLYSRLANEPLAVNEAWRATPRALTYTLAYQMQAADRLDGDVDDVTERYLESNIIAVRAGELAQMGATLANGGIQPISCERVLSAQTTRTVLSAMVVAGMYEDSGSWWTRVGLPAKSGVSGGIVAVVPGWGAIVAYSPRLDEAGNSVRASLAISELVSRWQLHTMTRLLPQSQ